MRSGSKCAAGKATLLARDLLVSRIYTEPVETRPKIGVLALQGAFREHVRVLRDVGAEVVEVGLPEQLDGLDGLVIPGGSRRRSPVSRRSTGSTRRSAGSIARSPAPARDDPPRPGPPRACRLRGRSECLRATGRELRGRPLARRRRAAVPRRLHPGAARARVGPRRRGARGLDGEPVLLRDGRVLVAAFHPELTDDPRIHERFLELVTEATSVRA